MDSMAVRIAYLEDTLRRVISELKEKEYLSQDFEFLTEAEANSRLDNFINGFISSSNQLEGETHTLTVDEIPGPFCSFFMSEF